MEKEGNGGKSFSLNLANNQIEITLAKERFLGTLGSVDDLTAKKIYAIMLRGKVTPCTAQDVLEDLRL